jgi:hypothetical protein
VRLKNTAAFIDSDCYHKVLMSENIDELISSDVLTWHRCLYIDLGRLRRLQFSFTTV